MLTKIKISNNISYTYILIKNEKFLSLTINTKPYYFHIPGYVTCLTQGEFIHFTCTKADKVSHFSSFSESLLSWLKILSKPILKKLILKGLGLKATLVDKKQLELKLGFSHTILIDIPRDLTVEISKNTISIIGFNKVHVGDFLYKIRNLKLPNAYKGKGIWYKNEIRVFKTVKKT